VYTRIRRNVHIGIPRLFVFLQVLRESEAADTNGNRSIYIYIHIIYIYIHEYTCSYMYTYQCAYSVPPFIYIFAGAALCEQDAAVDDGNATIYTYIITWYICIRKFMCIHVYVSVCL